MRIIAGEFRSRRLFTPADDAVTRPIPDRVKESLFGLLRGHCEGANVFDGFAGTGAIGLEAVSRGAARCVCIEKDRHIAAILQRNIESLGCAERCEVVIGDSLGAGALARAPRPLTLAFLDPPYPLVNDAIGFRRVMSQLEQLIALLGDDGFAILRTPWPLRHPEAGAASPASPGPVPPAPRAPRRKDRKHDRRSDRHSWRTRPIDERFGARHTPADVENGPEDPEDAESASATDSAMSVGAAAPAVTLVDADLKLPNAVGPETHAYHSMAVHLYAKKK